MLSVVCPFYDERAILQQSVEDMLRNLQELPEDWELIIVSDGSTDESLAIARELERANSRLRVLSYDRNRGRGHALRTGITAATGRFILTTEIDSSWGDHIVQQMFEALDANPTADIVIASPHLPGGGYKNVPFHRVALRKYGNYIIRTGMSFSTTMNTGMTRGYRADVIKGLPLFESGKEVSPRGYPQGAIDKSQHNRNSCGSRVEALQARTSHRQTQVVFSIEEASRLPSALQRIRRANSLPVDAERPS